jgi:hypothetical protein
MTRNLKDVLRDIASLPETDKAVLVGILVGGLNRRLDENEQPEKVPTEENDRELPNSCVKSRKLLLPRRNAKRSSELPWACRCSDLSGCGLSSNVGGANATMSFPSQNAHTFARWLSIPIITEYES